MLLNSVDQAITTADKKDGANSILSQIQYEGKRVNDDLVGLLAIYRINNGQYSINIEEYSVADFLEENLAQHESMILHRNIEKELECNNDLQWFFDRDLITGVMSNVINNLYKYTKDKILISTSIKDNYLLIQIKDNGPGYPENMLVTHENTDKEKSISFENSNTGLGLYFSRLVAELHKNKGKNGYITTSNDGIDGGGCFSIYLP
ncbi:MAG TPA: HAMP domain-containing histidine kinase [Gammaproteobacteria bacterium]|jgi:K+-sensing histidine kinase KdpD|nr:HAMP domain-containing histidine kinase [Gammaproteobacteria bacterium]